MSQPLRNPTSSVTTRKRYSKSSRRTGQYTGNLQVYTHASHQKAALAREEVRQAPVAEAALEDGAAQTPLLHHKTAANNDWIDKQVAASSDTSVSDSKKTLTLSTAYYLIAGSLAAGVLAGALWVYASSEPAPQLTTAAETAPEGDLEVASEGDSEVTSAGASEAAPGLATANAADDTSTGGNASISSSTFGGSALSVDTADTQQADVDAQATAQISEYELEISKLSDENLSLQRELDEVSTEALQLNQDLLDLELTVIQAQQQAQSEKEANTEQRVIYNFVNVPIGGKTPQQAEAAPRYIEPSQSYSEPVDYDPQYNDPQANDPEYVDQYASDMETILDSEDVADQSLQYEEDPGAEFIDVNDNALIDQDSTSTQPQPRFQFPPVTEAR